MNSQSIKIILASFMLFKEATPCMAMEEPKQDREKLLNDLLNNQDHFPEDLELLLNDIFEEKPGEALPWPEATNNHPPLIAAPYIDDAQQKLDDQKNYMLEIISKKFNDLMGVLFNDPDWLPKIQWIPARELIHDQIKTTRLEVYNLFIGNKKNIPLSENQANQLSYKLAQIQVLKVIENLSCRRVDQYKGPYPFLGRFPIEAAVSMDDRIFTHMDLYNLNFEQHQKILLNVQDQLNMTYNLCAQEMKEALPFKGSLQGFGSKKFKSLMLQLKRKMGTAIAAFIPLKPRKDLAAIIAPPIQVNVNNFFNAGRWVNNAPPYIPQPPRLMRADDNRNLMQPVQRNMPADQDNKVPHGLKRKFEQPADNRDTQPVLKRQASAPEHKRIIEHTNKAGLKFYGSMEKARPATQAQRKKYQEIFANLKAQKSTISPDNYAITKTAIKLIYQFHCENTQICRNLFYQFMRGNPSYLAYEYNPQIIIHCEQADMNIEDRAQNLYGALITSYDLAVRENLLVNFFTHAFVSPESGLICMEGPQKFLAAWYEDQMMRLTGRDSATLVKASLQNISEMIQRVTSDLEAQVPLPDLRNHTFKMYKDFLEQNIENLGISQLQSKLLYAEEAFQKHVTSDSIALKVVNALETENYQVDLDEVKGVLKEVRD